MADVNVAVRTYLLTKTAVTDIIGQRMYTDALPQGATSPAVVLSTVSESYDHALDGLGGIVQTRMQFECYASTRLVSLSIADAIIWCGIDQIKGTYSSINIRSVMVEDGRRCFTDADTSGGDVQRYVTNFDLMVTYLRT